jgi:potassium intermediate/small conductance calcium-activated channel subfamily N protein 2
MWNVIVAMTTVGYGDFYPKTSIGRCIIVFAVVLGILLTSLLIVALTNISSFTNESHRAFIILKRLLIRKHLHDTCQCIIKYSFKMFMHRKTKSIKELLTMPAYMQIRRKLLLLRNKKLIYTRELSKDNFCSEEDKFIDLGEDIDREVITIKENILILEQYRTKLKIQLRHQKRLIQNLEDSLKITKY